MGLAGDWSCSRGPEWRENGPGLEAPSQAGLGIEVAAADPAASKQQGQAAGRAARDRMDEDAGIGRGYLPFMDSVTGRI